MSQHRISSLPPDENEVVAAICSHLSAEGFVIEQQLKTTERGIDVEAKHPQTKTRVFVEAKEKWLGSFEQ
jgi:hypothetical protein